MKKYFAAALLSISSLSYAIINGEISIGVWNQDPKGFVQYPANEGDRLDVEKDLGLGDKTRFSAKVKLELPSFLPNIYLQYTDMKFSGSGNIDTIRFGDYVFVNTTVNTLLKAKQYDVGFYYHIPFVKKITNNILDPEAGIVVKIVDFKARVSGSARLADIPGSPLRNYSESTSETVPLPLLYLSLGIYPFKYGGIVGEFKGLKVEDDYFYEYSVALRGMYPVKMVKPFIEIGYRFERLRIKDEGDINADVRAGGFFGNVGIAF